MNFINTDMVGPSGQPRQQFRSC